MTTKKSKKSKKDDSKETESSVDMSEQVTSRTDITFSDEKKACLKFIFKCWRKCTRSKS